MKRISILVSALLLLNTSYAIGTKPEAANTVQQPANIITQPSPSLDASSKKTVSSSSETVAERFEKKMQILKDFCEKNKNDGYCPLLKLKPYDPLATPEGRFAHSIKLPHESKGDVYKPGMSSQEYFDALCKAEAGEFIYKTVENVEGIYQMRPREKARFEFEHLYAMEDPYGYNSGEVRASQEYFVQPFLGKYQFLEIKEKGQENKFKYYYRDKNANPGKKYQTIIDRKSVFIPYIVAQKNTAELKSQYGYTWRGIKRPHDRELGIAGGELIVLDLKTNEVLGVRRGFSKTGSIQNKVSNVNWEFTKVCKEISGKQNFKFIYEILKPNNSINREYENVTN